MPEIVCPSCGRAREFTTLRRHADEFCERCDYPLFWAPSTVPAPVPGVSSDTALRRLPGAGGRTRVGSKVCPHCGELNPLAEKLCLRCRNDLDPKPEPEVVVAEPPPLMTPPPQPEPVVAQTTPWWVWVLAGAGAIALILLVIWIT